MFYSHSEGTLLREYFFQRKRRKAKKALPFITTQLTTWSSPKRDLFFKAARFSQRWERKQACWSRAESAGKGAAVIDRRVQRERDRSAPAASKLKTGWNGEEKLHCQDSCNLAWPSHAQSRLLWPFPLFPKSTCFLLKHSHANQSLELRARPFHTTRSVCEQLPAVW